MVILCVGIRALIDKLTLFFGVGSEILTRRDILVDGVFISRAVAVAMRFF